jgi:hypothetical protein
MLFLFKRNKVVILALMAVLVIVGCQPASRGPEGTPPPKEPPAKTFPRLSPETSLALPGGDFTWPSPDDVSADGNYLALMTNDGDKENLWLYSVSDKEGKLVYSIPASEVFAGRLVLVTIGWTENNRLVFARQGTQPDGDYQGKRGLLLLNADPESGTVEEVSWLSNPEDYIKQVLLDRQSNNVLVHMGDSLSQLNLNDGSVKTLRTDLPRYDGLFFLQPSTDKTRFVYQFFEPDKRGIYLLDVATGEETCLARAGDTFSFSPSWSPDGQYIAFYTAKAKDTSTSEQHNLADKYDIVEGEDAPAPIASTIDVINTSGQKITSLAAPDTKAAMYTWSPDSQHLAFLGAKTKDTTGDYTEAIFDWQSLYIADLNGNTNKLADIPEGTSFVVILQVLADRVYYLTYGPGETNLWLAESGSDPQKLELPTEVSAAGGAFTPVYPLPTWENSLLVSYIAEDKNYYLQVWQDQVELLAEDSVDSFILATQNQKALLISPEESSNNKLTIFAPKQ